MSSILVLLGMGKIVDAVCHHLRSISSLGLCQPRWDHKVVGRIDEVRQAARMRMMMVGRIVPCSAPCSAPFLALLLVSLLALIPGCTSPASKAATVNTAGDAFSDDNAADAAPLNTRCVGDTCPAPTCATLPAGNPCDDGRACTVGDFCLDGECASGPNACACEPGFKVCESAPVGSLLNLCLGPNVCLGAGTQASPFVCVRNAAEKVVCATSTDTACLKNACVPSSGKCKVTPIERTRKRCPSGDGATGPCVWEVLPAATSDAPLSPCDDGLACSTDDHCAAGLCQSAIAACTCMTDADCPDDANQCNGEPFCDKSGPIWRCKANPATVVACSGGTKDCVASTCTPATGTCSPTPAKKGVACSDNVACTLGDTCDGKGGCTPGIAACCTKQQDCAKYEDGNACNGTLFCDNAASACKVNPSTVVTCNSGSDSACAHTACNPTTGQCSKQLHSQTAPCTDGDPCTIGDHCDGKGGCTIGTASCCKSDKDCAKEEDGDLCNGTLYCQLSSGVCKVNPTTVVKCATSDNTACLARVCEGKTGQCPLQVINAGGVCSDGNPCTTGDVCTKGACVPGTDTCPCKNDVDCEKLDDGDKCNGTLYCNLVAGPGGTSVCKLNPKTVVVCKTVADTACAKTLCKPETGVCTAVNLPYKTTCDADNSACTAGDVCDGSGSCDAGKMVCECQSDTDCLKMEDGDACNGTLFCDKASHLCHLNPVTIVQCDAGLDVACKKNACQAATGKCVLTPKAAGLPCDDGQLCTTGDHCKAGSCVGGVNVCACTSDNDCGKWDDGDKCNGVFVCKAGKSGVKQCVFDIATTVKCASDGNPCTVAACSAVTGICGAAALKFGVSCSDGTVCTAGDACDGVGKCLGKPLTCVDDQPCTEDTCDKALGCLFQPTTATCSDGDACTSGDICKAGACVSTAKTDCDDKQPCTIDSCSKANGCAHLPTSSTTTTCDDGEPCTSGDRCVGTQCKPSKTTCDDANVCTADVCDAAVGCTHAATSEGQGCDDGEACTKADVCTSGTCIGTFVDCDDKEPCTKDSCDKISVCVHTAIVGPCDDGSACTKGESCATGTCAGGQYVCDDGNHCTDDQCALGKCLNTNNSAACQDGNECTLGDVCSSGACIAGAAGVWARDLAKDGLLDVGAVLMAGTKILVAGRSSSNASTLMQVSATGASTVAVFNGMTRVGGMTRYPNNGWAIGGDRGSSGVTVAAYDAQGKVLWKRKQDSAGATIAALANTTLSDGKLSTVAFGSMSGKAWMLRLDDAGGVLADQVVPIGANAWAVGGAPGKFGDVYVFGSVWNGTKKRYDLFSCYVTKSKPKICGYKWTLDLHNGSDDRASHAVAAPASPLGLIGGTTTAADGVRHAFYVHAGGWFGVNESYVQSRRTLQRAGDQLVSRVGWFGGGAMMVGATPIQGGTAPWLVRGEISGQPPQVEKTGVDGVAGFGGYTAMDGSSTHLVAAGVIGGKPFIRVTDLFGNESCAASGPCIALDAKNCSDTNACTYDSCDAGHHGCWHAPLPDGVPCAKYGKTCSNGACQ